MKKNYITPEIKVIQLEALCNGDIVTASVFKGGTKECISNFGVVDESQTKDKDVWGESNNDKWGED